MEGVSSRLRDRRRIGNWKFVPCGRQVKGEAGEMRRWSFNTKQVRREGMCEGAKEGRGE